MNDGKLDVIAFQEDAYRGAGANAVRGSAGRHPNNKHVLYFQTDELTIESEENISTDIDGEHGKSCL